MARFLIDSLGPGQAAASITQAAPGFRVVIDGGEIIESVPGKPDRAKAPRSGEFFWQDAASGVWYSVSLPAWRDAGTLCTGELRLP